MNSGPLMTIGRRMLLSDHVSSFFRRWIAAPASMPWRKGGHGRGQHPSYRSSGEAAKGGSFLRRLLLHGPTNADACEMLWDELPAVSSSDQDWLELLLTLAEFLESLHLMPNIKSLGIKGLNWGVLLYILEHPWARHCHCLNQGPGEWGMSHVVQGRPCLLCCPKSGSSMT